MLLRQAYVEARSCSIPQVTAKPLRSAFATGYLEASVKRFAEEKPMIAARAKRASPGLRNRPLGFWRKAKAYIGRHNAHCWMCQGPKLAGEPTRQEIRHQSAHEAMAEWRAEKSRELVDAILSWQSDNLEESVALRYLYEATDKGQEYERNSERNLNMIREALVHGKSESFEMLRSWISDGENQGEVYTGRGFTRIVKVDDLLAEMQRLEELP